MVEDGPQPVRERLDMGLAREGPEQLTNADYAPAAHQVGRTSHSEEFTEKRAEASGAKPTKKPTISDGVEGLCIGWLHGHMSKTLLN